MVMEIEVVRIAKNLLLSVSLVLIAACNHYTKPGAREQSTAPTGTRKSPMLYRSLFPSPYPVILARSPMASLWKYCRSLKPAKAMILDSYTPTIKDTHVLGTTR